jgi:hypothetical protein
MPAPLARALPLLYAATLALLAAIVLVDVARWFAAALPFRWGIDYNEGIVWKQIAEIMAGRGYAPIDRFPAIVFHYPPLLHVLTGAISAALGVDPLIAGRAVSLAATLATAGLAALLVRALVPPTPARTGEVAGVLLVVPILLALDAVHFWGVQMRVDALANAFAFAGMLAAGAAPRRPGFIYPAAICFAASVFTKQISVVAPAAAMLALFLVDRKLALRLVVVTVLIGLVALGALVWQTDGGILRHLFVYNINRFDLARLVPNFVETTTGADWFIIAAGALAYLAAAAEALRNGRRGSPPTPTRRILLVFVPLATLSLIATAKYGSSSSYYMQWETGLAIFLAAGLGRLIDAAQARIARGRRVAGAAIATVPLAAMAAVAALPDQNHVGRLDMLAGQDVVLERWFRAIPGPVISDEMVVLMRTKGDVLWEPAIFAELATVGAWDERIILAEIARRRFAAIATDGDRGFRWFDERYSPAVVAALEQHYRRARRAGNYVLWLPAVSETPRSGGPGRS